MTLLLALFACVTEAPEPTATCTSCHGTPATGPAPPSALGGSTAFSDRGVGAHQQHLNTTITNPIACTECHLVPATVDAPGHIDDPWPADITWGDLTKTGGLEVEWNTETLTCSGSYCHGGSIAGVGEHPEPVWTGTPGSQSGCGACHGYPPALDHPDTDAPCGDCHPTANGGLIGDPTTHIDGIVQVENATSCSSACHGSGAITAPPMSLSGSEDPSDRGVGAHQAHLQPGIASPVACEECHVVPATVDAPGHLDAAPADLTWGPLATTGGTSVTFDGVSCAGAYCHGATLARPGEHSSPVWADPDTDQATCGSCHGFPPTLPHPATSEPCGTCHAPTADGMGIADPSLHIDGTVQLTSLTSCSSACHGAGSNTAPPPDLLGSTDTTSPGVGAHQAHLGTGLTDSLPCFTCHPVPSAVSDPGHADGTTDVVFAGKAVLDGFSASYDPVGTSCAVYCHAQSGGGATSPVWTVVDGSQSQCSSCHGFPPPPPHSASTNCGGCHTNGGPGTPGAHINGSIDF